MKSLPTLPDSGVRIDNLLTMALHRRTQRNSLPLILLALLGGISLVLTFLSMFAPECHTFLMIAVTVGSMLFFCWHAAKPGGLHVSLIGCMVVYLLLFWQKRMYAVNGLVCLMNAVCQTIYQTDWLYYEPLPEYSAQGCTTFLLCMLVIPIMGLLGYAVMRYHNFFLSMLVTFPFVEIGLFFGIEAAHLPAAGLFAFWCGMGAVQLASSGISQKNGRAGFMRRRNTFFPVSGMRFLLTERAGIVMASAVLVLFLAADQILAAVHYKRPDIVKELRTDFQYYAASVDWSDWSTLIPSFLKKENPRTQIELGKDEAQKFENKQMSGVTFSEMPQSRVYLRYRAAHLYESSQWSCLGAECYDTDSIARFPELNCYPPEFLYHILRTSGTDSVEMTLYNATDLLGQCIPYGYQKNGNVLYQNDDILQTATDRYIIGNSIDYENWIMNTAFTPVRIEQLLNQCNPDEQSRLSSLTEAHPAQSIYMPAGISVYSQNAVKSALLSACGYSDFARENYLALPDMPETDTIRSGYADLLDGFDAQKASPQEIIYELQLLRERLCSQVSYSLAPGKTPPYEDFVSWFLLENKQGYCMHYATAGVLLARMAGIPARYCDGYLVEPSQLRKEKNDGDFVYTAEILDSNAHAWCEVYIEGIGWIPFEFTYTYFTPPELFSEVTEPATEPPTETIPETTVPIHTGTNASAATTTPTETTTLPEEIPPEDPVNLMPLFWCLAVSGTMAGGLILARRTALRKREYLFQQSDRQAAARCLWRWMLTLMQTCGTDIHAHTAELLCEQAERHCSAYLDRAVIQDMLAVGTKLRCSPHGMTEEEFDRMLQAAQMLASGLYQKSALPQKFILKWFRHFV